MSMCTPNTPNKTQNGPRITRASYESVTEQVINSCGEYTGYAGSRIWDIGLFRAIKGSQLTGCISVNTEERLFQISSRPILTRFQKARAGLGLGLVDGRMGLRLRCTGT